MNDIKSTGARGPWARGVHRLKDYNLTKFLIINFFSFTELETYEQRVCEVARLVSQLPEPHKRMLELLCTHLEKVASKSDKNMMTVGNLGVCFGPTLLRDEEETVAAIIDIKFANVIVELLIDNWRQILLGMYKDLEKEF